MKPTVLQGGKFFPGFCILMVLLFAGEAYPQSTFAKKIIRAGSPFATVQSKDGAYVSISQTGSDISGTLLVRKVNSSGTKVWETELDFLLTDLANEAIAIRGIAQTTDGGYVLVGRYFSYSQDYFALVIKLGAGGEIQWTKRLGVGFGPFGFDSVSATQNGGFIVAGYISSGFDRYHTTVVRFSSSGAVVSARHFGTPGSGFVPGGLGVGDIVAASGSGFFLAGTAQEGSAVDAPNGAYVIKVDGAGKILWKKLYEIDDFNFASISPTSDNGAILVGSCDFNVTACNKDLFLLKLKGNGQIDWKVRFAFVVPIFISKVTQTFDGGYLVTGSVTGIASEKIFLFKIDSSGNVVFGTTFSGRGNPEGESIFPQADGGFLLFGRTGPCCAKAPDMLLLKLNSEGSVSGCNLSHSLKSSSLPFGNVKISTPQITRTSLSLKVSSLQVNSASSQKQVSTVCP